MKSAVISFPMLGGLSFDPECCFKLFGINIYYYGVIIAAGFILGALYCAKRAQEFGLTEDDLYSILIWVIPICIVGARLYYVAFRWDYFTANPSEIINIRGGGLAIYGGVVAGVLTALVYCRVKKLPFWSVFDLCVFGILIGQAIGRWGNFINREAYGTETDIFCRMGLTPEGQETVYVHPTFLYESLWNTVGFIALHIYTKKHKRHFKGETALLYILWYGLGRAWIEGLRTDSLYIGSSDIRVSQLLAAVSAAAALIALIICLRRHRGKTADG